jgi:hypothetical protein
LRLPFGKEERSRIEKTFRYGIGHLDGDGRLWESHFSSSVRVDAFMDDVKLMNTLVKRGTEHAKVTRGIMVWAKITAPIYWWCEMETYRAGHERLSSASTMHVECRGLTGEDLVKAKSEIPMGKVLKKIDFFSYQCLRNIVKQRRGHRLPEWATFIEWVKSLPFANELIFVGLEKDGGNSDN